MKKLIFILSFITCLSVLSCEKFIHDYKGEEGIYIYGASMNDSVGISFAYVKADANDYDYTFRINTIGNPATYDRKFIIEKIDEYDPENQAIEGVDYKEMKFGEYIMPAGKSFLDITIKFYRNPVLVEGKIRKLSFRLIETPDFKLLYNRFFEGYRVTENNDTLRFNRYIDTQRCIKISEQISRQYWWTSTGHPDLGMWSVKKSLLICEVLNLERLAWLSGDQVGITSTAYISYVGRAMQLWLNENPTYEDDGVTLMVMGPNANY